MRKVYEDQDMTMVGYYQSVLEDEGIETSVKNEYAQLAAGEVPFQQVYPELWVTEESNYERAVELIRALRDSQQSDAVKKPVSYKRSRGLQTVMWLGTIVVVLIVTIMFCALVQSLFE